MIEDKEVESRDDVRMETAIQTVKDVLLRFEESSEGTRSVYEVLGFVVLDLLKNGICPACLNEAVTMALKEAGSDVEVHIDEPPSTLH
ncbi:MAG: hypothetical protein O2910_06190 [Proteobacteria bacterium]|nr:hypothetical protein [Pseudomonadota bacterium]